MDPVALLSNANMIMPIRIVLTFYMSKIILLITTAMFASSATGKSKDILVLFAKWGKKYKIINIVKIKPNSL